LDRDFLSKIHEVLPKGTLPVYETEKPDFKDDKIIELSETFGIKGRAKSEYGTSVIKQKQKVLAFYKNTGAMLYGDFSKLHRPGYKPKLPESEKAKRIAEKYLEEKRWKNENLIFDEVAVNQFEKIDKERKRRSKWDNNISVDFRYSLDGIKTYGPGAKIQVNIGDKGEIIGLFKSTPSYFKYAEFPSHTIEDLLEIISWKLGMPLKGLKIEDVKLAYNAESCIEWRRFLQPAYIFNMVRYTLTSKNQEMPIRFEMHPIPATTFSPVVAIKAPSNMMEIAFGEPLILSYMIKGGQPPFKAKWESNIDGHLSDEQELVVKKLSIGHKEGRITSHTIKLTVTDSNGMQDTHKILVKVHPPNEKRVKYRKPRDLADPYVGVEWCNIYHGVMDDISGTDDSAIGFNDMIDAISGWSSRFNWGNDAAWEQDFKDANAPGGGTDYKWADNVHFAFFAGHGSSGNFHFGSTVDDHDMRAADARWGDGLLKWIVLHACQTMRANFEWDVWCDAFKGLHQMFGFHTNTQGSTPPLGTRFALWMSFDFPPFWHAVDMQTAWSIACKECYDSSREYSLIYAGQSGTDTHNDHLPGFGHVSSDPTSPYYWAYYKSKC